MHKRYLVFGGRLFFGLLALFAVASQYVYNVEHIHNYQPVNFFSFFTIQSNIFAGIILIISGLAALKNEPSRLLEILRGAAVLYMVITGIVYILLLSNIDVSVPLPWVNRVLHYTLPLVLVADWLLLRPKIKITFKQSLWWITFPITYLVYSLIRGHLTRWYPYPFLNPADNGYASVAVISVLIAAAAVALAWMIAAISRIGKWAK